jgi:hypothetical protein
MALFRRFRSRPQGPVTPVRRGGRIIHYTDGRRTYDLEFLEYLSNNGTPVYFTETGHHSGEESSSKNHSDGPSYDSGSSHSSGPSYDSGSNHSSGPSYDSGSSSSSSDSGGCC